MFQPLCKAGDVADRRCLLLNIDYTKLDAVDSQFGADFIGRSNLRYSLFFKFHL